MKTTCWGALAFGLLAGASGVSAQDLAAERGEAIARTWCVNCHAIGEGNQPSAVVGAPAFRSLAADATFSEETLRKALLLPHPVMPEFPVTPSDISALAAYIRSLGDGTAAAPSQRTEAAPDETVKPVAATGPAAAPADADARAESGLAARGREIVTRDCSPCHSIAGSDPSPVADAPRFAALSQLYPVEYLAEALAEGIMVPHETVEMPQYAYEPGDIGAILAHLEAVQEK